MTSSQHKIKYDRNWQIVEDSVLNDLPNIYKYEDANDYPCMPVDLVEWCEKHCDDRWLWWFDNTNGYIGFKLEEDLLFFKLSCL